MKAKFFKKLSLVLAVAMVLSVFSPAAGAFAASSIKLNSTKKYLHLGVDKLDTYNFNIKSEKGKGWKYFWESSKEEVAEVNEKNGVVTATGVGTAKITLTITDKDKEVVDTATATVVVRDNIKTVTISNPVEKLSVGEEHDYNRTFETVSGSTKKTSAITRWTVSPAEGASIDEKGVFVATEGGKYTVTAHSFQSKAKYEDWKLDPVANAAYELDTDTTEVTVADFMVDAKQKNLSKVDVVFSSPMTKDDVKKNVYINYMIGDVAIKEQAIEDVVMSADGLTATVEIYDTFVPKVTYKVTYTDMEPKNFVAATTNPEDVVGINITTKTAKINKDVTVEYELINAQGVVINQPEDVSNLNFRVSLENENEYTSLLGDVLMIFNKGDRTTVTATYHTYEHDANGDEKVFKDSQLVIGTEDDDLVAKSLLAWTITTGAPDFNKTTTFIAAGDYNRNLYVQLALSNDGKANNHFGSADYTDLIKLTSSDSSVLFVDEAGYLIPVKSGKVRVTVEYDKKYVGYLEVDVKAERKVSRLSVDKTFYANVSSSKDFDLVWSDKQTVKFNLLDQYGDKVVDNLDYSESFELKPLSAKAIANFGLITLAADVAEYTFDPGDLDEGRYQFLIYDVAHSNLTGQVTFDVKDPIKPDEINSIKVEVIEGLNDDGNIDTVIAAAADHNKKFEIALMAYAKNGIKLGPIDLASYDVEIKDAKGKPIADGAITPADNSVYNSTWVATGSAITKLETGRYTVNVIEGTSVKARGVFVVVDSQKVPTVAPKSFRFVGEDNEADAIAAFKECFEVKIGDTPVDTDDLLPVFESTTIPTKAYAKEVLVTETFGAYTFTHKIKVGYYITVPVDFDGYTN